MTTTKKGPQLPPDPKERLPEEGGSPEAIQADTQARVARIEEAAKHFADIDFVGEQVKAKLLEMVVDNARQDIGKHTRNTIEGREAVKINEIAQRSGLSESEIIQIFPNFSKFTYRQKGPAFLRHTLEAIREITAELSGEEKTQVLERAAQIIAAMPGPIASHPHTGVPEINTLLSFAKTRFGTSFVTQPEGVFFKIMRNHRPGTERILSTTHEKIAPKPGEEAKTTEDTDKEDKRIQRTHRILDSTHHLTLHTNKGIREKDVKHLDDNDEDFEKLITGLNSQRKRRQTLRQNPKQSTPRQQPSEQNNQPVGRMRLMLVRKLSRLLAQETIDQMETGQLDFIEILIGTSRELQEPQRAISRTLLVEVMVASAELIKPNGEKHIKTLVERLEKDGIKITPTQLKPFLQLLGFASKYPEKSPQMLDRWGTEFLLESEERLLSIIIIEQRDLSTNFIEVVGPENALTMSPKRLQFIDQMIQRSNKDPKEQLAAMIQALGEDTVIHKASNLSLWAMYHYWLTTPTGYKFPKDTKRFIRDAQEHTKKETPGIEGTEILTELGLHESPTALTASVTKDICRVQHERPLISLMREDHPAKIDEYVSKLHQHGSLISRLTLEQILQPYANAQRMKQVLLKIETEQHSTLLDLHGDDAVLSDSSVVEAMEEVIKGFGKQPINTHSLVAFLRNAKNMDLTIEESKVLRTVLEADEEILETVEEAVFVDYDNPRTILSLGAQKGKQFIRRLIQDITLSEALSLYQFTKEEALMIMDHNLPGYLVAAIFPNIPGDLKLALEYLKTISENDESWNSILAYANTDLAFGTILKRCMRVGITDPETVRALLTSYDEDEDM